MYNVISGLILLALLFSINLEFPYSMEISVLSCSLLFILSINQTVQTRTANKKLAQAQRDVGEILVKVVAFQKVTNELQDQNKRLLELNSKILERANK